MKRFLKWTGSFLFLVIVLYASSITQTQQSLVLDISTKTTTYTFLPTDYAILCNSTSGSFTTSLESAPITGQVHTFKKIVAANTCTLSGNGVNIDGSSSIAITAQYTSLTVQFDGTQWWIE
jgi:hypothetical protein